MEAVNSMIRGSLVFLAVASALAMNGCSKCSSTPEETAPAPTEMTAPAETTEQPPAEMSAPEATPAEAAPAAPSEAPPADAGATGH